LDEFNFVGTGSWWNYKSLVALARKFICKRKLYKSASLIKKNHVNCGDFISSWTICSFLHSSTHISFGWSKEPYSGNRPEVLGSLCQTAWCNIPEKSHLGVYRINRFWVRRRSEIGWYLTLPAGLWEVFVS
jgi:hypothetical protein